MTTPSLKRFAWLSIFAALGTIALKAAAWKLTGSVGLLSDALESIVNLAGAMMALAMLTIAEQPADDRHAYGHGKAEYFSSGFEGFLVLLAAGAIGVSELAAGANGINVHAVKLGVFVISAMMAGIAGFLYVHLTNFASPENFDFVASVMLLVVVALGGTGTYWGPFLGALLHVALPEALRAFADFEILVYGVALVLVLLFFPGGLNGAVAGLGRLVGRSARRGAR